MLSCNLIDAELLVHDSISIISMNDVNHFIKYFKSNKIKLNEYPCFKLTLNSLITYDQ